MADVTDKKPSAGLESYLEPPTPKTVEKEKTAFSGLRVSLMPTELAGSQSVDPRRALAILAIVLIAETVLIGAGYAALAKVNSDRTLAMDSYKMELTTVRAQTKILEGQAATASQFSTQFTANQLSLDNHLYWTSFFNNLEKYILSDVQCSSISGDSATGTVNMDCHGKTYLDVARQIVYMRTNPMLVELRTNAASADMDKQGVPLSTTFAMSMKFKPAIWHAAEKGKMPVSENGQAAPKPVVPSMPTGNEAPVPLEILKPATTAAAP